jgi:8-oxo-dGTP pyrophosphatase MutT (NUDIX family)
VSASSREIAASCPSGTARGAADLRVSIRSEVASINPLDALEAEHRAAALAWVDSGAPLFRIEKPATPRQHLVSYFAVVDGRSILLVDHRNARLWLPPGGHVEEGEHPRDTVAREMREELGFSPPHEIAAPLMITCTTTVGLTSGHTDVSLWYVVHASKDRAITYDEQEFECVRWFDFPEAPLDRSDPHLARFLRKLAVNRPPPGTHLDDADRAAAP